MTPSAVPPLSGPLHNDGKRRETSRAEALLAVGFGERDSLAPLLLGLAVAVLVHASVASTTALTPPKKLSERVEMAIYKPPPPPPPPEPPPPPPEPEKPKPKPPPPPPPPEPPPEPPPPPPNSDPPPEPPSEPPLVVPGISMQSTVQGGGPAVPVGNTTFGKVDKIVDPKDVKPYAGGSPDFKAARASTLTKEARVIKDYKGRYPPDLADQGIEGAVVLLVEIAKDGAVGNVRVAKTCGNATLDRLAQEYMKRFRFAAAEVDGEKVDSILRYTYRFELYE